MPFQTSSVSPPSPASRPDRLILAGIFLLSGAAALLFETLWFRLAGQVLGASAPASALVLSSFMGGLALGNALISRHGRDVHDPVRVYAAMEMLVGVWGAMLVIGLPCFRSGSAPCSGRPWTSRYCLAPCLSPSLLSLSREHFLEKNFSTIHPIVEGESGSEARIST